MSDRLVFVCGTPSGGTSCIAGMLSALGVDMGESSDAPGVRGYVTHEDTAVQRFFSTKPGDGPPILRQRMDIRGYLAYRRDRNPEGRIGVKGSALWWLDDPESETLPLDIVRVTRPLEDAIRSDQRILGGVRGPGGTREQLPWDLETRVEFAGRIAAAWWGGEELCSLIPPVVTVDYRAVIGDPMEYVYDLVNALKLPADVDSINRAAATVRRPPARPCKSSEQRV